MCTERCANLCLPASECTSEAQTLSVFRVGSQCRGPRAGHNVEEVESRKARPPKFKARGERSTVSGETCLNFHTEMRTARIAGRACIARAERQSIGYHRAVPEVSEDSNKEADGTMTATETTNSLCSTLDALNI